MIRDAFPSTDRTLRHADDVNAMIFFVTVSVRHFQNIVSFTGQIKTNASLL